ncbi:hypothetical protein AX16_010800 [Volvariella volvacea WC 439]|nr:hypothetical protein AX16_010800 [Volvariella volvacea WC 439]
MGDPSLSSTAGAMLLGTAFSWCFYGCLFAQFYTYYTTPITPQDPVWLLGTVGFLCFLEGAFTLVITHSTWSYIVVSHKGGLLLQGPWTASVGPAITGLVTCMVQTFLSRRIYNLSKMSRKGLFIAIVIVLLALTEVILSFVVSAKVLFPINVGVILINVGHMKFFQANLERNPKHFIKALNITSVSLSLSLVCDSIITINMIILLRRAKNTITGALDSKINGFIIRSVETGAVITIAASLSLFFFVRYPLSPLATILMYSVNRIYAMTLLASLNGRKRSPRSTQGHISTVII